MTNKGVVFYEKIMFGGIDGGNADPRIRCGFVCGRDRSNRNGRNLRGFVSADILGLGCNKLD